MVNYFWDNIFRGNQQDAEIHQILADNYIFKPLSKPELYLIKSLVHVRTYRSGEAIFKQGELAVGMYIVVKGTVTISVENPLAKEDTERHAIVTRLGSGDFFGEIALVEQAGRRTATAAATDDVVLIGFFKPDLAEIVERHPRTANKIITRLAEVLGRRLKETAERFSEVKRELKELAKQHGAN